ncbi:MAG: L,D-transpeptidase family protein [Pseudomonadota bacterium]
MRPRFEDLVVTRWGARFRGRRFACSIGRGGIRADKREGDGATPAGAMRLVGSGFRPDRLARPLPPRPRGFRMISIRPADIWSDDPDDPDYNRPLRSRGHEYSHERLSRADRMYDIFVLTDWNWPQPEFRRGSAIFVHVWKAPRRPTEGCVAFSRPDLIWIIRRWTPRCRLIVQL